LLTGIILLDDRGCVLHLNRSARQFLDQKDGLSLDRTGLVATRAAWTSKLVAAIADAALVSKGKSITGGGAIAIPRPSGKRPLSLLLIPASAESMFWETRRPSVIAFLTDPDQRTPIAAGVLEMAYGLTGAEIRLAEHLLNGETLTHAAELLDISHNTARTHLQRVYQKTGTNHQGDLIRLLHTVLP
jgi:DNA-binding CsgD family transcriptional regulator